jgi:dihydrofolate reductase
MFHKDSQIERRNNLRKIIISEYVTLDGVIEDPGGGDKSKYGGWSLQFWNDQAMKFKYDELFACDALLLGRVTYDGFAKAWPIMKGTGDFGERMNSIPKYVVSTTLKSAEWNNSTIINHNVMGEIKKLKEQPGKDILVEGSAGLVQALMRDDLADEFRLMIHPIAVGGGKRLFGEGSDHKVVKLADTKTFSSGIVVLIYQLDKKEIK